MSNLEPINPQNEILPAQNQDMGATLMERGMKKLRDHAEMFVTAQQFAEFITQTGACPDIYRGKPADATAAILRGVAMGFDPHGALEAFFVIKGKTGMYARAMIAVAINVGCKVWEVEADNQHVTWAGTRPGGSTVETVTWTIERAQQAGYTTNAKYKTNPQEMLRAKCQAELARLLAPGALLGLYSEAEPDYFTQPTAQATATRTPHGADGIRAALAPKPPAGEVKVDLDSLIGAMMAAPTVEDLHAVLPPKGTLVEGSADHTRAVEAYEIRLGQLQAEVFESEQK